MDYPGFNAYQFRAYDVVETKCRQTLWGADPDQDLWNLANVKERVQSACTSYDLPNKLTFSTLSGRFGAPRRMGPLCNCPKDNYIFVPPTGCSVYPSTPYLSTEYKKKLRQITLMSCMFMLHTCRPALRMYASH